MKALLALFLALTGTPCLATNIEHLTLQAEVLSISKPANVNGKANAALLVTIHTTLHNMDNNWIIYKTYTCERGPSLIPSVNYFHQAFRQLCYYNVPTWDTIKPFAIRNDTIILATNKGLTELINTPFFMTMQFVECLVMHGDLPRMILLVSKEYVASYHPDLRVFSQDVTISKTTIWSDPDLSRYRGWYFDQ